MRFDIDSAVEHATDIRSWKIWQLLLDSAKSLNDKRLVLAGVLDALFIFLFGAITGWMNIRMIDYLYELNQMTSETAQTMGPIMQTGLEKIMTTTLPTPLATNPVFKFYIGKVMFNILVLVLLVYIAWSVVQGIAWYFNHKMIGGKQTFQQYVGNFALQSLVFFGLTTFAGYLAFKISMANFIAASASPLAGGTLNWAPYALGVVWYFGFLSYTVRHNHVRENLKHAVKLGTLSFNKYIPSLVSILVLVYVVDKIIVVLFRGSYYISRPVSIIGGLLLLLPLISFTRVLLLRTTEYAQESVGIPLRRKKVETTRKGKKSRRKVNIKKTKKKNTKKRKKKRA